MYTLLHISDLHRSADQPISNKELMSSLIADFQRSAQENPSLPKPDAIIISGDLVEGLPLQSNRYPDALIQQYEEALDLLVSLAEEFVNGDRSRVIMVPGNHDVDWNHASSTCEIEEQSKGDPRPLFHTFQDSYRWSWETRQLLRITNMERYEQRFQYFNQMYNAFYAGSALSHPIDPQRPWNLFSLDDGNIIVCGFNSCVFNDCYSDLGHIRPDDIAECHLEIRRIAKKTALPLAIWHHGVGGAPLSSDYIDLKTVHHMIDVGFRVGLHGHIHDSTHSSANLYVSVEERMAVIGAGSLCAGPKALPPGVNRRYNVIQLDTQERQGVVHVRAMNQQNIWGPGQLFESGGQSYVPIEWSESYRVLNAPQAIGVSGSPSTKLDEIEGHIRRKQYHKAKASLSASQWIPSYLKRQLFAKIFSQNEEWPELARLLEAPLNDEELALYVSAAEKIGDVSGAIKVLKTAAQNGRFSHLLVKTLQQRMQVRHKIGGAS